MEKHMKLVLVLVGVFTGCCLTVGFIEMIVREAPDSTNMVTFSQFLIISAEGFIFTMDWGRKKSSVPLRYYVMIVLLFFSGSVANNWALSFHIALPLHMIFRSGSLIANMALGILLRNRRYSLVKYLSVVMITIGIIICTFASGKHLKQKTEEEHDDKGAAIFIQWLIGIALLTYSLLSAARLGIYQEDLYKTFGKHPSEVLFFSHALPLPGFLLFASDIWSQVRVFNSSPMINLTSFLGISFGIPRLWALLIFCNASQFDPGSAVLVTFAGFFINALIGFIFYANFGRKKNVVPLREIKVKFSQCPLPSRFYATMVAMFFTVNVANNYALNFNISIPLHLIFRSGSLLANMILGIIIRHRRYTLSKYLSVAMVTLGILICTFASGKNLSEETHHSPEKASSDFVTWLIGIGILSLALFMSARLGIYQETLAEKFGKHAQESVYYSHMLPLPAFLFFAVDMWSHLKILTNSDPVALPLVPFSVPSMLIILAAYAFSQYLCLSCVYTLTTECTSLTVTLVITLRKFISLVFSILYFKNTFTLSHWVGTVLVFGGTFLFVDLPSQIHKRISPAKKED
ncbi:unnamed protein product [Darwinula stevensoni]|uniref:UDP-xylose and UDP-N-acetylglucosamine transporter n=1 Tax=Darwinula stevensoni TaxID=69355 RepID=A0A7R8XIU2_9CRUS|nr:unnamed protein product [Darwinula stevensoni]CAG0894625.1 unnamed protein product [Darwinula stevensoni]